MMISWTVTEHGLYHQATRGQGETHNREGTWTHAWIFLFKDPEPYGSALINKKTHAWICLTVLL